MMTSQPSRVRLRVERAATGGGVAHLEDGRVAFVRRALPGELVEVELTEVTTRFARGEALEVIEASEHRVSPTCPHAHPGGCGGCDFQHADADAQRLWKETLVAEHLARIARLEIEVRLEPALATRHARTRLRCGVDEDGRLALRQSRSRELEALTSCEVADERLAPAFGVDWSGAEEVELRAIGEGAPFAVVRRPGATRLEVRRVTGEILDPWEPSRVEVAGHVYQVSPTSFWQSHREAPATLVAAVMAAAEVAPGDHAVDLYSGVGLFSVPLAHAVGPRGRVVAVEVAASAVRDARTNVDGVGPVKVREWSVGPRAINDAVSAGDVVVVDPPRTGLGRGVADALLRRAPRRLVYVSCDAATFARDVAALTQGGAVLSELKTFDLFPLTEHVELVGVLDCPG